MIGSIFVPFPWDSHFQWNSHSHGHSQFCLSSSVEHVASFVLFGNDYNMLFRRLLKAHLCVINKAGGEHHVFGLFVRPSVP